MNEINNKRQMSKNNNKAKAIINENNNKAKTIINEIMPRPNVNFQPQLLSSETAVHRISTK